MAIMVNDIVDKHLVRLGLNIRVEIVHRDWNPPVMCAREFVARFENCRGSFDIFAH